MDTTDKNIVFNDEGICNHCLRYDIELPRRVFKGDYGSEKLNHIISLIKKKGKKRKYDCIIGVSGGVDSTYVAYLTKKHGLNPLAIHFDNGWNSELAVSNIEKTLDKLNIDLFTYVINWEEFKNLQLSFLKASTPDGEIPTDHAITALLFREAAKRNINYIISGMNFATESISVSSWAYGHSDWKYIKSVHKKYGSKKLKTYPHFSLFNLFYWTFLKKIKSVSILNYVSYNKFEAKKIMQNKLDWKDYGGKHYESIYTRFYQGYILPKKFNIDKRRIHFSDLINAKQIARNEALLELVKDPLDKDIAKNDLVFLRKKFNLSVEQFKVIMNLKIKSFKEFNNNSYFVNKVKEFVNFLREKELYSK